MRATLTPALALDYLRELSTDLRAGVVLDAAGEPLAGLADVTSAARRLVASCPDARGLEIGVSDGYACVLASARHTLVLAVGPFALPGLLFHDMTGVLALLSPSEDSGIEAGLRPGPRAAERRQASVRWCPPGRGALVAMSPADPRHAVLVRQGRALLEAAAAASK